MVNNHIYVFDTNVLLFSLKSMLEKQYGDDDVEYPELAVDLEVYCQQLLDACIDRHHWLSDEFNVRDSFIVFVSDKKDENNEYWRHSVCEASGIDYKGNRPEPWKHYELLKDTFERVCNSRGVPYLSFPGLEADDFAGQLVSDLRFNYTLVTCDTDWLQLVSNHVTLLTTGYNHYPRYRTIDGNLYGSETNGVYHWNKFSGNSYRFTMGGVPIDTPRQIIDHKVIYGDVSDNLPRKNNLPMVIDLLGGHSPYQQQLETLCGKCLDNIDEALLLFNSEGTTPKYLQATAGFYDWFPIAQVNVFTVVKIQDEF